VDGPGATPPGGATGGPGVIAGTGPGAPGAAARVPPPGGVTASGPAAPHPPAPRAAASANAAT
jgi:hypothetical protein